MSLYVYAIVDGEARLEGLTVVRAGGVGAVCGGVDEAPPVEEAALRAHDQVVRRIATEVAAVLPVRFGTVVRDEGELVELLAGRARGLAAALRLVEGRVQMTLRMFAAEAEENERVHEDERVGVGTRYLAERARAVVPPGIDRVRAALERFVRAERSERQETPPLVGSVFHLVDAGEVEAYVAAAAALEGVRVSGPFPPYAFAPEVLG